MTETSPTLCITCSLPIGEPLRLNHLPSGQACPTCRDRVLATIPPALPARPSGETAQRGRELEEPGGEVAEPGAEEQAGSAEPAPAPVRRRVRRGKPRS